MDPNRRRTQILKEMAGIGRMEKGRVTEEYRERVQDGKALRTGPYYKHQRWENGRNVSRRVPLAQADQLCVDVEQYHRFEELAKEYAEITIAMTRADYAPDAKKKP